MADEIKVTKVSKKFGVSVRGSERYHQAVVDSTREFIKQFAKSLPDWKKEARGKQIKVSPDQNYCPAEVAAIINRSYDTALRLMKKLGASNLGTPTRRHKRGKSMYVVSGRKLLDYLKSKA